MIQVLLNRHFRVHLGALLILMGAYTTNAYGQTLATGNSFEPPILRLVAGLILSIFLAYLTAIMIRNWKTGPRSRTGFSFLGKPGFRSDARIRVVETKRINAQTDICLISSDGREYLVLTTPTTALVLREMDVEPTIETSGQFT